MTITTSKQNAAWQFWVTLSVVAALSACIIFYKLGAWPWDHDEVPCLVELGVIDSPVAQKELGSQLKRLPKLLPVWYGAQQVFLKYFTPNEFGSRVLSATCGVLTVIVTFVFSYRWRGLQFALGLAILIGLSQCFVWLTQQNRFYSMATLWITISLAMIWTPKPLSVVSGIGCLAVALLAVFSHNLAVVIFGIGFIAAVICYIFGGIPLAVLVRCGLMASVTAAVYVLYLRPIVRGWISGGTGGTNEIVSFAAQLGMPTIALAALGIGLSLRSQRRYPDLFWWTICLAGGVMFVGLSPWLVGNWNPRYALFFMIPFWVLAAFGIEQVAVALRGLGRQIAWYGCIVLLLLPKLASHYCDGSRHDFRTAAAIITSEHREGEPVYCNWPETLSYYLKNAALSNVESWPPSPNNKPSDKTSYLVVLASNAFERFISPPDMRCDELGEITKRRFDEQSHVVRIYRIWPPAAPQSH